MSFNTYTSTFIVNEDGTSVYTINMSEVMTKCMQAVSVDPKGWIDNAVHNRSRISGEEIYKKELERHLEAGTMPTNSTKESLILAYQIPVEVDIDTSSVPNTQ